VIGGVAWAAGVTLLGYLLGGFTFVREHIELMLIAVVVLSLIPLVVEFLRDRRERRNEVNGNREVTELG
jgi:membrane-associated protein